MTELGIVTLVRLAKWKNAYAGTSVMPLGITSSVTNSLFKYRLIEGIERSNDDAPKKSPNEILHQAERSVMYTLVKLEQSYNAPVPIEVIELGNVILVRLS